MQSSPTSSLTCGNPDIRPWGQGEVLNEGPGYKIKILTIHPKSRLSLQYHHHRSETWTVLSGQAHITVGTTKDSLKKSLLRQGQSAFIPKKTIHRIENAASRPLRILEVQWGQVLQENDIVRLEDDYGRIAKTR